MTSVDWGPGLAVLAIGLLLGGLVLWRVTLSGPKAVPAAAAPSRASDLEAERDVLFQQLRELDDTGTKRTPEQLARERYALELKAAGVLLSLDESEAAARPQRGTDAADKTTPARKPALRGFFWGVGSAGALGLLVMLATRGSQPRENAKPSAGPAQVGEAAPASDPEVARYKTAIERNPDDFEARIDLARVYLGRQDLMGVWNETQYVLARVPGHPRALAYQALVRLAMGQADVALEMLKQAKAKAPDLLEAYLHLSLVYVRLGRVSEAEAVMAEARKRFPDQATMLAALMAEMTQQMPDSPPSLPGDPHASVPAPQEGGPAAPPASPTSVAGQLDLDPVLRGSLPPGTPIFVTLRAAGADGGPPIAVKRLPAGSFPLAFAIGAADSMMGQELPERVRIEARADTDGDPITRSPADPTARVDDVKLGSADLRLVLRR
jgi:cytochrome c-type biogenesis protein CcmH